MSTPYIGEIRLFPYNFAPRGWAFCNGQIMAIAQNTALFSLLGTTYGGDGRVTFALPDLRGRVPISSGQGPGLPNYSLGQTGGESNHTLISTEMPAHNHTVTPQQCSTDDPNSGSPKNNFPATTGTAIYSTSNNANMGGPPTTGMAGGTQPHNNMQPYLTLNYCIALEGIFPSRN